MSDRSPYTGGMCAEPAVYYDPYDVDINADPYPTFRRLREEAPLYYNEQHDFYALSRYDDVERGLVDWRDVQLGPGRILELIKAGVELPPGTLIFEDPPTHDIHRRLLSRVFTPQEGALSRPRSGVLRPQRSTRSWAPAGSTSSPISAPRCRCGSSACCSGSPRRTRRRSATASTPASAPRPARPWRSRRAAGSSGSEMFADYIDWRAEHPADDLMTELLNAEFEDETGRPAGSRGRGRHLHDGRRRRGQRDHDPAHRLGRQGAGRPPRPAPRAPSRTRRWSRARSRSCCASSPRPRTSAATSPRTSSTTTGRSPRAA